MSHLASLSLAALAACGGSHPAPRLAAALRRAPPTARRFAGAPTSCAASALRGGQSAPCAASPTSSSASAASAPATRRGARARALIAAESDHAREIARGWVAGYNHYLEPSAPGD